MPEIPKEILFRKFDDFKKSTDEIKNSTDESRKENKESSEETKGVLVSIKNFFHNLFDQTKRGNEDAGKRDKEDKRSTGAIVNSLKGILNISKETASNVVSSTIEESKRLADVQGILQSQLGPLTPLVVSITDHFKKWGKSLFTHLKTAFIERLKLGKRWNSFRTWIKDNVNIKKYIKKLFGWFFLLPILLGAAIIAGIPAFIGAIAKLPGIKSLVGFFKGTRFARFKNLFMRGGRLEKIGQFFRWLGEKTGLVGRGAKLEKLKNFFKFTWLTKVIKMLPGGKLALRLGGIFGKIIGRFIIPFEMAYKSIKGIFSAEGIRDKILSGASGLLEPILKIPELIGNGILWVARKIFGEDFLKDFKFDFGADKIIKAVNWITKKVEKIMFAVTDFFTWLGEKLSMDSISKWMKSTISGIPGGKYIVELFWGEEKGPAAFEKVTFKDILGTIKKGKVGLAGQMINYLEEKEKLTEGEYTVLQTALIKKRRGNQREIITIPEAHIGAVIKKGGLISVKSGEAIIPEPLIKPITSTKEGEIINKVVEITKTFEQNITKVIEEKEGELVGSALPLETTIKNIPMIIEDTGLILVSSGVL